MKRDLSCFDQNSHFDDIDDWCLNCSSSIFWRVVLIWLFCVKHLLYNTKPSAMCSIKDVITYGLPKAINLKDVRKQEDVFLSVPAENDSGKSWHSKLPLMFSIYYSLFHCCTTYSTSLSLTCWSFNLTFTGSWRLKAHWARTQWQIFSKFQNFFLLVFRSNEHRFRKLFVIAFLTE